MHSSQRNFPPHNFGALVSVGIHQNFRAFLLRNEIVAVQSMIVFFVVYFVLFLPFF